MELWRWLPVLCCWFSASACTDLEARLANRFLDTAATDLLNDLIKARVARTFGSCRHVPDDSLQPCRDVKTFPIQKNGSDYQLQSFYATHFDTMRLANASLRCDTDAETAEPSKHFFVNIRGTFGELAVDVHIHVGFPPITIDAPCYADERCVFDERKLGFTVAGRVVCESQTSFGLELDRDEGLMFDRPIEIQVNPLPPIDITPLVKSNLEKSVSKARVACPERLAPLCAIICRGSHPEEPTLLV